MAKFSIFIVVLVWVWNRSSAWSGKFMIVHWVECSIGYTYSVLYMEHLLAYMASHLVTSVPHFLHISVLDCLWFSFEILEDNYLHAYDVSVHMEAYLQNNTHFKTSRELRMTALQSLSTRSTVYGVETGRLSWLNQSRTYPWADMRTELSGSLVLLDLRENISCVSVSA
jgi:hypothetical protein